MPKTKPFRELRAAHEHDPVRRARREEMLNEMWTALKLAELRRQRGLSQKSVADAMGISQARISRIESGQDLQVTTLQNYICALGGHLEVNVTLPDQRVPLSLAT